MYTTNQSFSCTINNNTRETHPSDFPWQYGMSQMDGGELTFVVQYLNCEDAIVNGNKLFKIMVGRH